MELEFYNLFNSMNYYKKSIVKNLDKVEEAILQVLNNYEGTRSRDSPKRKHEVSLELLNVLRIYVKILYLSETLLEELTSKLDRNCSPERGDRQRRNSNPFFLLPLKLEVSDKETAFVKTESEKTIADLEEQPELRDIFSDTETIVNFIATITDKETELKQSHDFTQLKVPELPDFITSVEAAEKSIKVLNENNEESVGESVEVLNENNEELLGESVKALKESNKEPFKNERTDEEALVTSDSDSEVLDVPVQLLVNEPEEPVTNVEAPIEVEKVEKTPVLDKSHIKSNAETRSKPQYTALEKLLTMTVHDRRREAEKKLERNLPSDFRMKPVGKSPAKQKTTVEKKTKPLKSTIYEIEDDVLTINQKCSFSCVVSPMEFYVRTNQALFESLENSLNEDLNNQYKYVVANYKSKDEAKAILGNFCFVFLIKKQKWFRAQVINWMEDESDKVLIQLIDHGAKYMCKYENLRYMTELYSKFPKMVIKCHFAGIYSPDKTDRNKWPQESTDALIELSEMNEMTKFSVIYVRRERDSFEVDLIKEGSDRTLGEILTGCGLAVQEEVPNDTSSVVAEEDMEDYDNINEAITGYDAQDEARICPFTDNSGKCFKGPSCKLEHSKLSKDGITTDKALIVSQALTQQLLPSKGDYVELLITSYVNTCHFYAQIIRERTPPNLYNNNFHRLIENMNSNNIVHTYAPFKVLPGIGEIALVKHNQEWYRGRCIEHIEHNQVAIFLVDFGISVIKKLTEIKHIKDEFLYLPFQAVECVLNSICETANVQRNESREFYEKCMHFKHFRAYVMGVNEPLKLRLFDCNNLNMDFVLKECGLAQDRIGDVFPAENSILQLL